MPRLVVTDADTSRQINVSLPKTESQSFKSEFTRDFGKDLNRMLREAFGIQKLIGARKPEEAGAAIEKFKKDFGSLAFGHVMAAQLALSQGKKEEARASLMRARAMDPDDNDISQMLKLLGVGEATAGGTQ